MIVRESTEWLEAIFKKEIDGYIESIGDEQEEHLVKMEKIHKMLIASYDNENDLEKFQVIREDNELKEEIEKEKISAKIHENELNERIENQRKKEANRAFITNTVLQGAGLGLQTGNLIGSIVFRNKVLGFEANDLIVGKTKSYSLATKNI